VWSQWQTERYVEHSIFRRDETATSAHYVALHAPVNDVLDEP
jgi:hypothetical protein